ncbi:MAG: anaerobic ribonucleoside-triphosphate reductase activating protein [Candidatus Cloacimonetes bacterium]|nr:anaerobic ribonucleoside-triphosphate reductase activating protein [Candidatus Cloacimonadota bacterium]
MKIGGLQKFSLLDYPGELSAIVFTQGCNFRCPFCHNPELVEPSRYSTLLDTEKVLRFLYKRRKKLSAVVITGGEPTLQEDLIPFMRILKAMRYKLKLDTNGSQPEVLCKVIQAGVVDYIAMDLKAPPQLYHALTQSEIDVNKIMRSMELIRLSGIEYEFRSTYVPELLSWNALYEIQNMLQAQDRYFLQECNYSVTLENLKPHHFEDYKIAERPEYLEYKEALQKKRVKFALRA